MFGFAQVDIEVPDELYDKFSKMAPLFKRFLIPEEMKIYKENTGRKSVTEEKKVTGCYKGKKYSFLHAFD